MSELPEDFVAVEQLLSERDALRGWLTRLDQAESGVPEAVRQRVRADYQRRLDQLIAGLQAHADVVSAKLTDDRTEHADLLARATGAREALAEAELRHAVGEYDAEKFEAERRRFGSDVETFEVALGAAAERIARLEEIHALMDRTPRPTIDEVTADPAGLDAVVEVHSIPITELAADTDDGLAVFDDPATAPGTPESGPLSFRPSATSGEWPRPVVAPPARVRPFDNAPPLGIPAADVSPRFIRPGERLSAPPAPPSAIPVLPAHEADAPAPARDEVAAGPAPELGATTAGKTLRCGECGAMNRPLEWYCEKCGAELTAV